MENLYMFQYEGLNKDLKDFISFIKELTNKDEKTIKKCLNDGYQIILKEEYFTKFKEKYIKSKFTDKEIKDYIEENVENEFFFFIQNNFNFSIFPYKYF